MPRGRGSALGWGMHSRPHMPRKRRSIHPPLPDDASSEEERPEAPGRLRGRFRSVLVQDGLLDEEGVLVDATGTVVAQSRQLALIPRPA